MLRLAAIPLLAALGICSIAAQAPFSSTPSKSVNAKSAAVTYLFPEQITVVEGKPTAVDLHFKVADGLHINSHTPHTEELIPTTLKLPESAYVRMSKATFPAGKDFSFPINPAEKLNVYTGEFVIHVEFVASKGDHLVEATLRYQACNNEACFPPRSIPVAIDVIAK